MLSQLPAESDARAPTRELQPSPPQPQLAQPQPVQPPPVVQTPPVQTQPSPARYSPPTNQMANASFNEKAALHNQYASPPPQPPPAYPQVPPIMGLATALYAYTPTDAGDLALQPHDRIQVIEHMNDDCMICP